MLSKQAKRALDVALASKKDADKLVANMAADAAISKDMERKVAIAVASDKAMKDIKQAIDAPTGSLKKETEKAIDIAMSQVSLGDELKAAIKA